VDPIEIEGVNRARKISTEADLIVRLHSALAPPDSLDAAEWNVFNMADRLPACPEDGNLYISVKHAIRLDVFMEELKSRVGKLADSAEPALITRARHRHAIERALPPLREALDAMKPLELRAEDLRIAGEYMASITGTIASDELLGEIFGRLCIGQ
jgi:tRNA modification GTPase